MGIAVTLCHDECLREIGRGSVVIARFGVKVSAWSRYAVLLVHARQ